METVKKIKEIMESTRDFIQSDGGDIEFIDFKEGLVYVKMHGACVGCSALNSTLFDGVESILIAEVPGVIGIELVKW